MGRGKVVLFFVVLAAGALFAAIKTGLILILPQTLSLDVATKNNTRFCKKTVNLFYWSGNRWNSEMAELLWTGNNIVDCKYLVNRWLAMMDEENLIQRRTSVQAVLQAPSGKELYLSFDRTPLDEDSSTFEKLTIIEGLLRTLKAAVPELISVNFRVHHSTLSDDHLDFSVPWLLTGFLNN